MTDASTLRENERVALHLAHGLTALGDTHVVISPGSRSTPLALAFDAHDRCHVHVVLDERAAAFVALGIARATGRPAIVVATSGSAGANHLPAVVEANVGRVPLVVVTANRPGELQDCGAPQTMPQRALFGEHVRAAIALPEPAPDLSSEWLRNTATRALLVATGSPPGPVHVDVPFREPLYDPSSKSPAESAPPSVSLERGARRLSESALERVAAMLHSARDGAIVCGPLAPATLDLTEFASSVAELADALGWPILADATSGLRFGDHDRRLVVSSAGAVLSDPDGSPALAVGHLLAFGQPPTLKATSRYVASHRNLMTLINSDETWPDGGGVAGGLIVADPATLCRDLSRTLRRARSEAPRPEATGRWLRAAEAASRELASRTRDGDWEGRIVAELLDALPPHTRLHVASSMPIRDLEAFGESRPTPLAISANRGVNGIDGTVATALGIAVASGSPTVALLGDLAFLHDLDGLEAASTVALDARARLVLVVVDNGGGGIFAELPIGRHPTAFERLFLTPRPADIGGAARALDARYEATNSAELGARVRDALEHVGVSVLHVRIDRSESSSRRKRALLDAAAAARTEARP